MIARRAWRKHDLLFQPGQTVRLSLRGLRPSTTGEFQIVKRLPDDGGEQRYRIKTVYEPHERVARESELQSAASEK
jgi:hypothetical protein